MTRTELHVDARGVTPVRLRILGPDGAAAQVVRVDGPLVLGTSEHVDVRLTDPAVSRRHLTVQPAPGGVHVRDESSRNGTWLGHARILEAELSVDDTLRVGSTTIKIELDRFAPPRPPAGTPREGLGRFLGRAEALQALYRRLDRAAASEATILLEGESGTGKELLAEAIHDASPRAQGPFVVVDCASLAESLVESTLFGHERGSFTGAHARTAGAFESARGGTVFLDEIGELPLVVQARLLGVLERRSFTRVGGTERVEADVRVVAATNRDLEREVEEGRFRLDLFHRLAVVLLRVPSLAERTEDIPLLADHLAGKPLPPHVHARLTQRRWPGNVRELRNYVERLSLFGEFDASGGARPATATAAATAPTWLDEIAQAAHSGLPFRQARERALAVFAEHYAADMLARAAGNVTRAAAAAGVARRYFYRVRSGLAD